MKTSRSSACRVRISRRAAPTRRRCARSPGIPMGIPTCTPCAARTSTPWASPPPPACLSVLFGYIQLFRMLDSLLTIQANSAYITGFPAYKETQNPNAIPNLPWGTDGKEQAAQPKIEPGKLYPFDISPIDQPQGGADLSKVLQNIQALVERAMPAAFSGAVGADQSGYALNQAAYLAGLAFNPIVANAEVALAERTGFESWLIENRISENVYAWGEQEGKKGGRGAG